MTALVRRERQFTTAPNGKRALRVLAGCVTLMLGLLALPGRASTPPPLPCVGRGCLRVYDRETGQQRSITGNSANWTLFGWCRRADLFTNTSRTRTACVYEKAGYRGRSLPVLRGMAMRHNFGCSNDWKVTAFGCRGRLPLEAASPSGG